MEVSNKYILEYFFIMNKRSIRVLEFNKILDQLSDYAVTEDAKRKVAGLRPYNDRNKIEQLQQNTRDAFVRLEKYGQVSFSGIKNIKESLKLLEIDSTLSASELLDMAALLEAASEVKKYGEIAGSDEDSEHKVFDSLTPLFDELLPLEDISSEIRRCIISSDEIADDASSNLKAIRRKITSSEAEVHNVLNKMIKSSSNRDMLMDALITMRNGRYCIPVKIEHKNAFPGMVHDRSATGSTVFIEPMQVVEINNSIQELHNDELLEIEKILSDLSAMLTPVREEIYINYKTLIELDFCFAKAKYAAAIDATEPVFNDDGIVELKRAVHPLLEKSTAVPIDLTLGDNYNLLIITGPNTGGKTVSLKTLGLLTLMGQAGLHIPAMDGSRLSVFDDVFADIGDEQSIELSLSTFSSHMTNIIYIVKHATAGSLVLFDEPGGGTDPTEGAALAISILESLKTKGARVMATTHYTELKTYAIATEGVENASCEFDIKSLKPTYRLMIGIPGSSNAFAIAKRLGMPDDIIEAGKKNIDEEQKNMERIIAQLEESEKEATRLKNELEIEERSQKQLLQRLSEKEEKLDTKKEEILEKARIEAREILEDAKSVADDAIKSYNKWLKNPSSVDARDMEKKRSDIRNKRDKFTSKEEKQVRSSGHKTGDFSIGDRVRVLSLNVDGHIVELADSKGLFLVEMGILTSRFPANDLLIIEEKTEGIKEVQKKYKQAGNSSSGVALTFKPEINLLGKTVDEAIAALDKYLDDALLTHVEQVTIIHGKGTGALRTGIWNYLKRKSFVKDFRKGEFGEGDAGVTIVTFK